MLFINSFTWDLFRFVVFVVLFVLALVLVLLLLFEVLLLFIDGSTGLLKLEWFFTFILRTWFDWFVFITGLVRLITFGFSIGCGIVFVFVVCLLTTMLALLLLLLLVVLVAVMAWVVVVFGWPSELVCPIEVESAASYRATMPFSLIENSSTHEFWVKKSCCSKSPEVARLFGSIINASYYIINNF